MLFLSLLFALGQTPEPHADKNPIYKQLRAEGIPIGEGQRVALPPPTMPDGLDAAKQQEIIAKVAGRAYRPRDLLQRSRFAPEILQIEDASPSEKKTAARAIDFWFVAYGNFDVLKTEKFLDSLKDDDSDEWTELKKEDLAQRQITIDESFKDREGYGHSRFDFINKVRIQAVMRSLWSETDESLLIASVVDDRFRNDPQFPNRWQSLDFGKPVGEPQAYESAGYYVKITRMAEPKGALFIEARVIYLEPYGWFQGANLLRSKLPPIVQKEVRDLRFKIEKATRDASKE